MANNSHEQEKPVRDDRLAPREVPYRAGGKEQGTAGTRKASLLSGGPGTGFVPGHDGSGPGSSANAGFVEEKPRPRHAGPVEFGKPMASPGRKPMPRHIPVHKETTRVGTFTRFLDGHTELTRDRPGLVELANNPELHPDDRQALHDEVTARDAWHNHRYW